MNDNLFSIGEIAEIKGITIPALRFYDRIGLIKPSYKDPSTKYRYYSIDQFIQFDIIKAARSMGISPKDIKVILNKKDTAVLLTFMNFQKESAAKKIDDLQDTILMINAVQDNIHKLTSGTSNQEIYTKDIPQRLIMTKTLEDNKTNEKDVLIEYSNLYKLIDKNKLINTYETGFSFTADQKLEYRPSQIFNTVAIASNSNSSDLSTIQSGRFLCISYNKNTAQNQTSKFNAYLKENNLSPSLILQIDLLNNVFDYENQYFELQALI